MREEVKDRILASALFIVLAAAIGAGTGMILTPRPHGDFSLQDQNWLAQNFPSGKYVPDRQNAIYYQVCLEESWHRFYSHGLRVNADIWCWK